MFLERFIQYIEFEKRYSPHTVSAYQSDLDQFFKFLNHPEETVSNPAEITYQHIRSWMVHLMSDMTARSVNRKIATLRKYFKFLLREGLITNNPTSKIQSPKNVKHLPVVVEDAKLSAMLTASKSASFRRVLRVHGWVADRLHQSRCDDRFQSSRRPKERSTTSSFGRRASSRWMNTPNTMRPMIAAIVRTATAIATPVRPMAGSSKAIW